MTDQALPMGTVTFLFSDIEGSTQLVAGLEPLAYRDLLELHHARLRAAFARHGGVEPGTRATRSSSSSPIRRPRSRPPSTCSARSRRPPGQAA